MNDREPPNKNLRPARAMREIMHVNGTNTSHFGSKPRRWLLMALRRHLMEGHIRHY